MSTTINFKPDFHSYELQSLTFPVEIRKQNLALVAKTLSSESVNLEAGTYHVVARLPAGQELYQQVTVANEPHLTVTLAPSPEDESPSESLEVARFIQGEKSGYVAQTRGLESLGAESSSAKLRLFTGNLLQGAVPLVDESKRRIRPQAPPAPGVARFTIAAGSPALLQILQPATQPMNLMLPISPNHYGCEVLFTRRPDEFFAVEVHLANSTADAALQYYGRGFFEEANVATASNQLAGDRSLLSEAEGLLAEKVQDPIGAAIGAYTLLRQGQLARLRHWTENLKNWFHWLPDGLSIRAEHLALAGEHEPALKDLIELPVRGLPIFSDGLSYAINRLSLYLSVATSPFAEADLAQAQTILQQLQSYSRFVDFHNPIVTFTGIDPYHPDDETFTQDIDFEDGIDLADHVG